MSLDTTNTYRLSLRTTVGIVCLVLVATYLVFDFHRSAINSDFIQYWSAYHTLLSGGNAYDPVQLFAAQKAVGFAGDTAMMYWPPPWGLALLSPILQQPLEVAFGLWRSITLMLHFICALLAAVVAIQVVPKDKKNNVSIILFSTAFLFSVFFPPIFQVLDIGQISIIPALGFVLAMYFMAHSEKLALNSNAKILSQIFVGFFLALTTLKPHLFYLVYVTLGVRSLFQRKFEMIAGGLIGLLLLFALGELLLPGSFQYWFATLKFGELGSDVVPRLQYMTPTLGSLMRSLMSHESLSPLWPTFVVPATFAILATLWAFNSVNRVVLNAYELLCIASISAFTAPYGWYFDLVILSPMGAMVVVTCWMSRKDHPRYAIVVLGAYLCLIFGKWLSTVGHLPTHFQLWWFGAGTMLVSFLMYAGQTRLKVRSSNSALGTQSTSV